MLSRRVVMIQDNARPHTAAATQNLTTAFGWQQFDHPPYSPDLAPSDFRLFLHLKSFLASRRGGSTTTSRSKKPLPLALHRRRHYSRMKGYKNWCNAMTSASIMVDTMSKISVRCVHQMAIYMVCNIFLFFLNSPPELTFWITLVFRAHVLIVRRSKLYYTASGIITHTGGLPVHGTATYRCDDTTGTEMHGQQNIKTACTVAHYALLLKKKSRTA